MPTIRILTDTPGDVPQELVQKYNMGVLHAYINFGPTESLPDDGIAITPQQFYERLPNAKPLPTTAAYSPGEAEAKLREMLETADHIVAVHTGQNLSAMINSTRIAAKAVGEDKVTVIDSGSLSMGCGWVAIAAAEAAHAGGDVAEIVRVANSVKERLRLWAVPTGMDYLRRSGRVNTLVASVGEILQIKPVIAAHGGEIGSAGRVRTFKKVIPHLVELAQSQLPLERLAVLHLHNPEGVKELEAALKPLSPENTITVTVTSAIGANMGPGGLGICTVRKAGN